MFAVVGIGPENEGSVAFADELFPYRRVDGNLAERRFGVRVLRLHAGRVEANSMAGAQEEDALVGVTSRNLVEGRCRYIPTEDVPCVRHDNCLRCGTIGNRMQPWADHSVNFLGGSRVERAGNSGFSYLLGVWIAGHRRRVYEGRESGEKDGYMKTDEHLSSKITVFCENVSRAGGFFRPLGSRRGGGTVSGAGQGGRSPEVQTAESVEP